MSDRAARQTDSAAGEKKEDSGGNAMIKNTYLDIAKNDLQYLETIKL